MDFGESLILFVTLFMMLVGLVFTLMPPGLGTILVWAAAIFYGLALGWDKLGWLTFGLLTFLMAAGIIIDYVAGHFGAKLGGASCLAIAVGAVLGFILGIVASLLGTPIVGCLAGLVGMVGGVLLIEWRRNRDWRAAWRATQGYIAGAIAGALARIASGILMVGIFLVMVYTS
jgi:uncharacterized protein